jgi:Zn-dependent protease
VHIDASTFIFFGCLVVAVILHEISHGVVAYWFGDDTAKRAGRLTLNPMPHIDPVGSILLPAMGAITGAPVIGWAKPVPINPNRLHNPRTNMFTVGLAGPASNLLLAAIGVFVARYFVGTMDPGLQQALHRLPSGSYFLKDPVLGWGFRIAYAFAMVNVFLAVFNLIPIPPLDGSAIFELVMPDSWRPGWYRFRQYGLLILFAVVFWTGLVGVILDPFIRTLNELILR